LIQTYIQGKASLLALRAHIAAESVGEAHRTGSCGQSESALGGKVCRREASHVQVLQQKEMSLLMVADSVVFACYCFMKTSVPGTWRQKGSRAAGGGGRKAPSAASGMDETKFPTKRGILALSGGEGIKTERAKIVPPICVLFARENRSVHKYTGLCQFYLALSSVCFPSSVLNNPGSFV